MTHEALRAALKPFAGIKSGVSEEAPNDEVWFQHDGEVLLVADFRRAAEAYAALVQPIMADGWKDLEITDAMCDAGADAADGWFEIDGDKGPWLRSQGYAEAFKAMVAAAPTSPAPASKVGHTGPNGGRLSAPDLAHRFVAETYGYQPQDPMARYLRERFTEYIEIDRAMAPASKVPTAAQKA